jgi:sugar transferase (PEP-CTERM/EpsH1 system associated)
MKILWVKAGGLVPPDSGGKIRSYNILRQLARQQSVTLFSFHDAKVDQDQRELGKVFERVVCVPLALPQKRSTAEFIRYAAGFLSPEPYNLAKYCRPQVRKELTNLLRQESYDVMVCDFLMAAGVIPWEAPIPKVLFAHNVEAAIWRHHRQVTRNPLWKALAWRETRRMEAAERRYLRAADHVLTVSENDRGVFSAFVEPSKLTVVPTGVDSDYFQPAEATQSAPTQDLPTLVFIGSMDWLPNEDAIFYFMRQVLPLVRREFPAVSLYVVGRNPSQRLQSLAAKTCNLQVTGRVADVRPFLARASVIIVPLRIGGGTRVKVFEAMAMGKAVVSTSLGAEGLAVQHGQNILLADSPAEFAEAVCSLLRDIPQRQRLGASARQMVEQNYSWTNAAQVVDSVLKEVAAGHAVPASAKS